MGVYYGLLLVVGGECLAALFPQALIRHYQYPRLTLYRHFGQMGLQRCIPDTSNPNTGRAAASKSFMQPMPIQNLLPC
jgi:hypothetical protein